MKYMLAIISEEMDWGEITPEEARAGMALWDDYTAELRYTWLPTAAAAADPALAAPL